MASFTFRGVLPNRPSAGKLRGSAALQISMISLRNSCLAEGPEARVVRAINRIFNAFC